MTNLQKLRTRPPKIIYTVIKSSNDNMTAQYTFSGSWAYQILPLRWVNSIYVFICIAIS